MGDEHNIHSHFTFWLVTCPDPDCRGYERDVILDYQCKTCLGRDLHPIPMSELYSVERLFYLYERTKDI